MSSLRAWFLASCALSLSACATTRAAQKSAQPVGPIQHVVLVTIDGLVPDSYVHADARGLRVPTLRRFVAQGAYSDGALSAFPTLTYPSHASIATGVWPARHGIVSNRLFDPLDKSYEAWLWYAEDFRAKPIWQVAYDAGLQTALVEWPTTVGATATWLLPEVWRARTPDDLKLVRALATPGLLARVQQRFPGYEAHAAPPDVADEAGIEVVEQILSEGKPNLLLLHIFQVDGAQHDHGLWSPEALSAIENADVQLARLIAAYEKAGLLSSTVFVVASDHGFTNVSRQINPGVWLREAGLLEVDEKGKPRSWQASLLPCGGTAYLYVDTNAPEAEQKLQQLLASKTAQPGSGIESILNREQIAAKGGDPRAAFALEAELGTTFGGNLLNYEGKPASKATHGYDPARPEMKSSLLLWGPSVQPGVLKGARTIDIAPTIAQWLSLQLPDAEGHPLQ